MGSDGRAKRQLRKLTAGFAVLGILVAVLVVTVVGASMDNDGAPELRFPPYWSEIKEGETTRAELRDRLGEPGRVEGDCLLYERLVVSQNYKFCFRGQTLFLKAAY